MSIRPLVTLPDPLLRKISQPITIFDNRIRRLAEDMLDTMYHAFGIGLAAIQVGEPARILVTDVTENPEKKENKNPIICINPQIIWCSEEHSLYKEGCLSIPDYYAEVERPAKVYILYYDLDGKKREVEAHGLLATCIQHEINHLDGVLFVDHLSRLKRDMVIRKLKKRTRNKEKERIL